MSDTVTATVSKTGTGPDEVVYNRDENPPTPVDSKLTLTPGGRFFMHQEWMSGESGDVEVALDAGAGCGSSMLQVKITKDGRTHYWHVSMSEWLQQFVNERLAAGLPEDGSTGLIVTRTADGGEKFESSSY